MTQGAFAEPIRRPKTQRVLAAEPKEEGTPLTNLLHAALLAAAVIVFVWPIGLVSGVIAGAVGAAQGALIADRLVKKRYRLPAIFLFAGGAVLVGRLMIYVFIEASWMAELITPVASLHVAEVVRWGSVALAVSLAVRAIAIRYRAALAVEGAVGVLAVASTVAAHRDGMIARPLEISDWFWTQGIDPVIAFLAVGLGAVMLLAGVLAYGRSPKRTAAQLIFVFLLGSILAMRVHGADVAEKERQPPGAADSKEGGKCAPGKEGEECRKQQEKEQQANSGFKQDDMPQPGGGRQQNHPAAVVVFHKDVEPATGIFYFRHASFSQFNGTRLVEATRGDVDEDVVRSYPTARQEVKGTTREQEVRSLVATDVALLTDHKRLFALLDPVEVSPMPNPEPARFRRAYSVVSNVLVEPLENLVGVPGGNPDWSDEVWEHYTALPKDKRYKELAKELQSKLRTDYRDDPIALAVTVKQYLEKNATYSFSRNYEGEEDPTAAFLFSDEKKGYCVHLAHAAAYLLRANGVPARVSAGYGVPAENLGGGSSLLIKQGDAHAWAEIYLEDIGWVPIEVTPEKTDVKPSQFSERDLQQLLGEMARKEGRDAPNQYQGPRLSDILKAILRMVPWVLAALIAAAYAMKIGRLVGPYLSAQRRQPIVSYRAALDRLSAAGIARDHGEPRERFAKRVENIAPSFAQLTSKHVAVAFGSKEARQSIASVGGVSLARLSGRVGSEVRKNVPLWRYALGVLNPFSWLWSR